MWLVVVCGMVVWYSVWLIVVWYSVYSTSIQCTVLSVQCTVYNWVYGSLYTVWMGRGPVRTLYQRSTVLYTVQCTPSIIHSTVSILTRLYTLLHRIRWYSVHYQLYIHSGHSPTQQYSVTQRVHGPLGGPYALYTVLPYCTTSVPCHAAHRRLAYPAPATPGAAGGRTTLSATRVQWTLSDGYAGAAYQARVGLRDQPPGQPATVWPAYVL